MVVRRRRDSVGAWSLHAGGQEHVVGVVVGQGHLSDVAGGGGVDSAVRRDSALVSKVVKPGTCAPFEISPKTFC